MQTYHDCSSEHFSVFSDEVFVTFLQNPALTHRLTDTIRTPTPNLNPKEPYYTELLPCCCLLNGGPSGAPRSHCTVQQVVFSHQLHCPTLGGFRNYFLCIFASLDAFAKVVGVSAVSVEIRSMTAASLYPEGWTLSKAPSVTGSLQDVT